jgi:hypothetical protein
VAEGKDFAPGVTDHLVAMARERLIDNMLRGLAERFARNGAETSRELFSAGMNIGDGKYRERTVQAEVIHDVARQLIGRAAAVHAETYGARASAEDGLAAIRYGGHRKLHWDRATTTGHQPFGAVVAMDDLLSGQVTGYATQDEENLREHPQVLTWVTGAVTEAASQAVRPDAHLRAGIESQVSVLAAAIEAGQLLGDAADRGEHMAKATAFRDARARAAQRDHHFDLWVAGHAERFESTVVQKLEDRIVADGHLDRRGLAHRQAVMRWGASVVPKAATAGLSVPKNLRLAKQHGVVASGAARERDAEVGVNRDAGRPLPPDVGSVLQAKPPEPLPWWVPTTRAGIERGPSPDQMLALQRGLELR